MFPLLLFKKVFGIWSQSYVNKFEVKGDLWPHNFGP